MLAAAAPAHPQGGAAATQARLCTRSTGEAATAACRRALELGLPPARQPAIEALLAARLAGEERWDDVVEVYRAAVGRRPEDGEARLRLGAALLHMKGQVAEAEVALREAVRLRPEDAEARVALGSALSALGRGAEAASTFEEALRLDPKVLDGRPAARAIYEAARQGEPWPEGR
ncbi:MAG TPA: tetratricopeptide repeat protein [Vicinamibacteria bacterium]|nr:tetratricopeptide repeat protein [Vicinamibacteria bacterium]